MTLTRLPACRQAAVDTFSAAGGLAIWRSDFGLGRPTQELKKKTNDVTLHMRSLDLTLSPHTEVTAVRKKLETVLYRMGSDTMINRRVTELLCREATFIEGKNTTYYTLEHGHSRGNTLHVPRRERRGQCQMKCSIYSNIFSLFLFVFFFK